ncbi:MAG: tRNA (adenosine(37)-N6)-dimethylallyltransferase MiaA [Spirochaetes bacterium GWF1_41_5]|nr:MAG: tRNA (adenosine(37)-N6)-dimethylallyltransferase MiaA [Spirochaetes bacterium GWF1_41_5]HBE03228.1 tRNA (adenosine(37)-N6)-dimethylallyltransferase MiaA [Spirochaetia bacterium]
MKPRAVIITGPTASGKTRLVHSLYQSGDLIINADSMQVYQYCSIGTAKPHPQEITQFNYRLIDCIAPDKNFSVYDFFQAALELINRHQGRIFIAGGTPLYIRILKQGIFSSADVSRKKYEDLLKQNGADWCIKLLIEKDPEYAAECDLSNSRRVIRALSAMDESGKTFTEMRRSRSAPFVDFLTLILQVDRQLLYDRINKRTEEMFAAGFIDEVKNLISMGITAEHQIMQAIGYRDIVQFLSGNPGGLQKLINTVQTQTRNFAKRQETWFRREPGAVFVNPDNLSAVNSLVYRHYNAS